MAPRSQQPISTKIWFISSKPVLFMRTSSLSLIALTLAKHRNMPSFTPCMSPFPTSRIDISNRPSGGSHTDMAWKRTGYCGLGRAVERLNLRTSVPLNIDFIVSIYPLPQPSATCSQVKASSVGAITDQFLRSLYLASQGRHIPIFLVPTHRPDD